MGYFSDLDNLPGAVFSDDRQYRYFLQRKVAQGSMESKGTCVFCLLNGSKANETENDPTVTGLYNYAHSWGYGLFLLVNIFGLAATNPRELYRTPDPVGSDNDWWLDFAAAHADLLICGWGNHGEFQNRGRIVADRFIRNGKTLYCLEGPDGGPLLTKQGQPRHTLYLKACRTPQLYRAS